MQRYDVAVVGLGPVGAVLGNLLGAAGLSVVILERDPSVVAMPRAVAFDGEIMRVFQTLGLADAVAPLLRASSGARYFAPDGSLLFHRAAADRDGLQGWRNNYTFHQPLLEQALRDGLTRFPSVHVRLRHDVFAVNQSEDGATVHVEDMGTGRVSAIEASYVVGCDGARSLVRRLIGGGFNDLGLHEPWVVADFTLRRPVDLPECSSQYCDPLSPITYVRVAENRHRWEFKLPPGPVATDAASPAQVWRMVSRWLTPEDAILERSALYTFHSLIAERWRDGRLLIAGDSAHQTPPFLGQGLCAGIRDAANLAWKLERIINFGGSPRLLATYETERADHVDAFIQMAVDLGRIFGAGDISAMRERSQRLVGAGEALAAPRPRLGPGLAGEGPDAGTISDQPLLADGSRMDDRIGYRFALVGVAEEVEELAPACRRALDLLDIVTVTASGPVGDWLDDRGARLMLIRPDRYILASFATAQACEAFIVDLRRDIGSREYAEPEAVSSPRDRVA